MTPLDDVPPSAATFEDETGSCPVEVPTIVTGGDRYMLDAALELSELVGVRVVTAHHVRADGSCSCDRSPPCKSVGKHPRGLNWQQRASADPAAIEAMWKRNPHANIAIATGVASGVVVLDVDGEEGELTLAILEHEHGPLPHTVEASTGRGRHIYFAAGDVAIPNTVGEHGRGLGKGLDLRCENGCVIAPPSMHESGKRYAWVAGHELGNTEVAALPHWIREHVMRRPQPPAAPRETSHVGLVDKSTAWARAALDKEVRIVRAQHEGTRNVQLNRSAFSLGQLVATNALDASVVRSALKSAALETGLTESEIMPTIASGLRGGLKDPRSRPESLANERAALRLASGEHPGPNQRTADPKSSTPRIVLEGVTKISAPLTSMQWACKPLQLGAGRVNMFAGFGASFKTLSAQSMLVSLAAGVPIWGRYAVPGPTVVAHLDFEQGRRDTFRRYQRLVAGLELEWSALGNRLFVASYPQISLTSADAEAEITRIAKSVQVLVIDSFKASANVDENSSDARVPLDMLSRVCDRTGCTIIVLHHAGKPPKEGYPDPRSVMRGSSALYDAGGAIFSMTRKGASGPVRVEMIKQPASACGAAVDSFRLEVEDVAVKDDPTGGVRVAWRPATDANDSTENDRAFEVDAARLLSKLRDNAGISSNRLILITQMNAPRARAVLKALKDEGRITIVDGPRGAKQCNLVEEKS